MARKGKEIAGSSSSHQHKRRAVEQEVSSEEEDFGSGTKPEWTSGPLSSQPDEWQAELFHDQMNALTSRRDAFICEKEVSGELFDQFGVLEKFEALGWEAALKCYDRETKTLYDREVQEWVATLRCPPYSQPSRMRLIGSVGGTDVEMSFDTLRRVAKFDSKPFNQYMFPSLDDLYHRPNLHPRWNSMLDELFLPGTSHGKLLRKNLKVEAQLLLLICLQNIIPRRGDKVEVRYPEVPILYMLIKGEPLVPFRFLVLNNIWLSRNSLDRKIIPHCRLITALLKKYGVIGQGARGAFKKFKPLDLRNLGTGWLYRETERTHELRSHGQRWTVVKRDARPLREGEVEGEETEESEDGEELDRGPRMEYGGPSGAGPSVAGASWGGVAGSGQPGSQSGYVGSAFDYGQRQYDQNWAHYGSMEQVVERQRPPVFGEWSSYDQLSYDHQTFLGASMERALKRNYDRSEELARAQLYAHEYEVNQRYLDDRRRRMREDYLLGRPVVPDPPVVDYQSLPPYDGSQYYPEPALHHSQWVDPQTGAPQFPQPEEAGNSDGGGSFSFGAVWRSLFG